MDIVARIRDVAQPLARAEGVDLLDIVYTREGHSQVLRLTIERPQGPTSVADCESVSRAVGRALDGLDLFPDPYRLEVTSAGLTRPLASLADFERSVGRLVRIVLRAPQSGEVLGTLAAADADGLSVTLDDGTVRRIPLAEVARARREIPFGLGRARR